MKSSAAELTAFGGLLREMMAERGVSSLYELARLAGEAGYPLNITALIGYVTNPEYQQESLALDPNLVNGPAEALSLG